MSNTPAADVARIYAYAELNIFPCWWIEDGRCACPDGDKPGDERCASPGKHPLTRTGVHDATHDLDTVTRWWKRWPRANIGMPAHTNGLAVLDVDPGHGGDESFARLVAWLERKGYAWPETLTANTGGGGHHYVFREPDGGIKGKTKAFGSDMPGLDTRGRGGYIIVQPSTHISGGVYEWVDFAAEIAPWPDLLTRLMDPPKPPPAPQQHRARPKNTDRYAGQALDREVAIIRATGEGGRNDQVNTSAFNIGQLVGAGQLDEMVARRELYAAAVSTGLSENEAARTIHSGLRAGQAAPRVGRAA